MATSHALVNKPVRPRPALKLIKTADLNREQWLAVRQRGVGSSDAGAAVALNPYQSQLELWMVKTGRGSALPFDDPNDESSPMYWGTLWSPSWRPTTPSARATGFAR
jgi:hypothetical protein